MRTYDLCFSWEQAKRIVENNEEIECFDSLNNYLVENELSPFQMTEWNDLTEQLTYILNNEINNAIQ